MTIDLDALEAAAKAAIDGPWNMEFTSAANPASVLELISMVRETKEQARQEFESERLRNSVTITDARRAMIDAIVGGSMTGNKADLICSRDGYHPTGVILTHPDGKACLVNQGAVRWLHGEKDLWNLLFTDSADNVRLIAEAVAAEREACAALCDRHADAHKHTSETSPTSEWREISINHALGAKGCAEAIRNRGTP